MDWNWLGPFRVVRRVSPDASELELPESIPIHRVQPVSLLDPVVSDQFIGHCFEPTPFVKVDGEEEYQVSSVQDNTVYKNQLQSLIRCTGCDSLTWEPAKSVDWLRALKELHQRYPDKPGPLENLLGGHRT